MFTLNKLQDFILMTNENLNNIRSSSPFLYLITKGMLYLQWKYLYTIPSCVFLVDWVGTSLIPPLGTSLFSPFKKPFLYGLYPEIPTSLQRFVSLLLYFHFSCIKIFSFWVQFRHISLLILVTETSFCQHTGTFQINWENFKSKE